VPILQVPQFLMRLANSRGAAGDRQGCAQAMDEAIALASGAERANFESQREVLRIDDDIDAGHTHQAAQRLAVVLAAYREREQYVFLRHRPDMAARLADFALAHGIEPEFVRALIERNGLSPPAGACSAWPFRLRVKVLGRFELVRDGQALRFSGKLQQRPLDLLKFVVACGARAVDSQQAMAALWPDADGAAAKASFDATLFRLRKLLDVDQAITLSGGKLSLTNDIVWTDVRALEGAIEAAQGVGEDAAGELSMAAMRLVEAYPGALLGDDESPWIAKPRDALRARFTRTLMHLGEILERRGHWSEAVDLYRRGLEADNLAEAFYRGLMRSLVARGEHAEALNAYRRCRELLSIVLGLKPSAETERVYRQIGVSARPAGDR
jgi:DNA-binding SARP family transcriptional activator